MKYANALAGASVQERTRAFAVVASWRVGMASRCVVIRSWHVRVALRPLDLGALVRCGATRLEPLGRFDGALGLSTGLEGVALRGWSLARCAGVTPRWPDLGAPRVPAIELKEESHRGDP